VNAVILHNLNYWYPVFLLKELNDFFEVRVALMLLLEPGASLVDIVDLFVALTMLLELLDIFLRPFKVFLELGFSILRHEVYWHCVNI
jgi:hypothetical protein